jgi:hypothetical protein
MEVENLPKPIIGELRNHPHRALDSRTSFFRDRESYLLYLWMVLDSNDLMATSMKRLDNAIASRNGTNGIPSAMGNQVGDESSVTTPGGKCEQCCGCDKDYKKIQELSKTINEHGKKMIPVAKMKIDQRTKELSYKKEAEAWNSVHTLSQRRGS